MHIYKSRTFVYIIMTNIHSGNVDLSGIFFFYLLLKVWDSLVGYVEKNFFWGIQTS